MRLSRNSIQKAIGAVVIGTGFASSASAGLVYELRYTSGPAGSDTGVGDPVHNRNALVGTYGVELWARASGTNGTNTDEGIQNSLLVLTSTQSSGGAALAGGLANGNRVAPFDQTGSRNGVANNITNDGMGDWGGTATEVGTDTTYMLPRSAAATFANTGVGNAVDSNTWEFRLATFDLNVTDASGTGITSYNVIKPAALKSGVSTVSYAAFRQDNATTNLTPTNSAGFYAASTGIQLLSAAPVTPEPASLGLIGAAAVGLLGRRRHNS